jgi:hypothetical protein
MHVSPPFACAVRTRACSEFQEFLPDCPTLRRVCTPAPPGIPQDGMRVLGRAVVVRCLCSLAPATQSPSARSSFASGAAQARGAPAGGAHPPFALASSFGHQRTPRPLCRMERGAPEARSMSMGASSAAAAMMRDFSIETTPTLAARIEDHRALLPPGTTVYVAAIPGKCAHACMEVCACLRRKYVIKYMDMLKN